MGKINSMLRIVTQASEAEEELQRISNQGFNPTEMQHIASRVRETLTQVLLKGDQALLESLPSFLGKFRVSGSELDAAYQQVNQDLLKAIQETCHHLLKFYQPKVPKAWVHFAEDQVIIGKRYTPIERVGIYIPAEASKGLMALLLYSICAKVAKVKEKVLVLSPEIKEQVLPGLLLAAQETGITEIYRLPGVQAIGALAYGTSTIAKVDLILGGSGDLEVTLAKQMVTGKVRVESYFNYSNLFIFADSQADPLVIARDILAQAEEGQNSAAILVTKSLNIALQVQEEVEKRLQDRPTKSILLEKALIYSGLIIVVESLAMGIELINNFAPQALQLAVRDPWSLINQIHNAGTIFMGYDTSKMIGDYFGGSAINLLGYGVSRYASALSVETFLKQSNVIEYSPLALKKLKPTLQSLADTEFNSP